MKFASISALSFPEASNSSPSKSCILFSSFPLGFLSELFNKSRNFRHKCSTSLWPVTKTRMPPGGSCLWICDTCNRFCKRNWDPDKHIKFQHLRKKAIALKIMFDHGLYMKQDHLNLVLKCLQCLHIQRYHGNKPLNWLQKFSLNPKGLLLIISCQ